jgi:hypothetical protein
VLVAAFAVFFYLAYGFWSVLPITASKGCVRHRALVGTAVACAVVQLALGMQALGKQALAALHHRFSDVRIPVLQGQAAGHLQLVHHVHLPRHRRHRDGHV